MIDAQDQLEKARQAAERAQGLLAQPATLDSYDWTLVAVLVVEADEALELARSRDPSVELPLLPEVLDELRDATSNFTNRIFLRASKSSRRQRPNLFR